MDFINWLKNDIRNRRILITSDTASVNRLIRRYEIVEGIHVAQIECASLAQIAGEIYSAAGSGQGFTLPKTVIDRGQAIYKLRDAMREHLDELSYFTDPDLLTPETCAEIYDKLCLLRGNHADFEAVEKTERIFDLSRLVLIFEDTLAEENLLDQTLLVREASSVMRGDSLCAAETGLNRYAILEEEEAQLTREEREFLSLLGGTDHSTEVLRLMDAVPDDSVFDSERFSYFKGYGLENEANYVVSDILKQEIPFGDAAVFYTNSAQQSYIQAAFSGRQIPVRFITGKSLQDNSCIGFLKLILDWFEDDYSERTLAALLRSGFLYIPYSREVREEETGKTHHDTENAAAGEMCITYITDAANRHDGHGKFILGWGFERNRAFMENEAAQEPNARRSAVMEFHRELLSVFSDDAGNEYRSVRLVQIFDGLLRIVGSFHPSPSRDYNQVKDLLHELHLEFAYDTELMSPEKAVRLIRSAISQLSVQEGESGSAVSIFHISSWIVTERRHIYIIGLSLKDFQGRQNESPVLSDEEAKSMMPGAYIPTAEKKLLLRQDDLRWSLMLCSDAEVKMGYSSFDKDSFCDNNPCTLFRAAFETRHGSEDLSGIPEFVYGTPSDGTGFVEKPDIMDHPDLLNPSPVIHLDTSNSSIEIFVDCPRKYAMRDMMIDEEAWNEKDSSRWLNAMHRGTFYHQVFQEYVEQAFLKPRKEGLPCAGEVQDELLSRLVQEEADRISSSSPANEAQRAVECEQIRKTCRKYLVQLHREYDAVWYPLATEYFFKEAKLSASTYPTEEMPDPKVFHFSFLGYIDRIDYRIDHGASKVFFRVVDYKTGRQRNKASSDARGDVIQHLIYESALSEDTVREDLLDRIALLEKDESVKVFDTAVDRFDYVFPTEERPELKTYTPRESQGISRLRAALTLMCEKNCYPNRLQLAEMIGKISMTEEEDDLLAVLNDSLWDSKDQMRLSYEEKKGCSYCDYRQLCDISSTRREPEETAV